MQISNYMTHEHRSCDGLFAEAEKLAASGEWDAAEKAFLDFANETLKHFKKEEEELFPAFEAKTGSTEGPTQVMRFEHEQVRGLVGKIAEAIEKQDRDAYLSLAESMMILLQQHNMKEEQMLYAMCDRVLPPAEKSDLVEKMEKVEL
ncbi:hemerythrin domain-containing protein [Nitratifractor sp.]|uniref:hemerythrin domain-containing protein n=1 Tax=Nitratifractor sp. TaxID=2268144 RepID=UPI0025DD92DF|nr:hemerythrin domain-containing protein [Nitratifractor sp.]